jgi:uncharacterized protein with PIN domain
MVRIVELKPDPSVVKQVVCKNCGAKLEYVPADIHSEYVRDYGGVGEMQNWITCPNCNHAVTVSEVKLSFNCLK